MATRIEKLWYNERDLESAKVVEFIEKYRPHNIADVGCHASYSYAGKIRKLMPRDIGTKYTAIDILYDDVIAAVADEYIQKNINDSYFDDMFWACIICMSSIEHSGITTYKVDDYKNEQIRTFKRLLELTDHALLVSVPYGKEGIVLGQYANITHEQLDSFLEPDVAAKLEFWYNENSTQGKDWVQITQEGADKVELQPDTITRCVCIIEVNKEI